MMLRSLETMARGAALAILALAFSASAQAEIAEWNCGSDEDCSDPDRPYCDFNSGDCVGCLVNDHCEIDEVCHQTDCIVACVSDDDCQAPTSYCSMSGVCFECLEDGHCSGDEPLCLVEDDNASCVECIIDEDCPEETPWCKPWTSTCVECVEHIDCDDDEFCSLDACTPDVCEPGALICNPDGAAVLECNVYGSDHEVVDVCPNADCEDGVCGGPQGTGTDAGDTDAGDTDAETSEGPGDTTLGTDDNGVNPLGDRGCACSTDGGGPPVKGVGAMLLVLLGLRRSRR